MEYQPAVEAGSTNSQSVPAQAKRKDRIEMNLRTIAAAALLIGVGLLPIVFVPGVTVHLAHENNLARFVCGSGVRAIALAVLRQGTQRTESPLLASVWAIAIATVLSALLTNDRFDALVERFVGPDGLVYRLARSRDVSGGDCRNHKAVCNAFLHVLDCQYLGIRLISYFPACFRC